MDFPTGDFIAEPTSEQCDDGAELGDGIYACWYPQMGGYTSHCVVMIDSEKDGCFEAYVWHDGEFPFNDEFGDNIRINHIHHCSADQFIDFGRFIKDKQR